jgi:hypothetical protein
MHSQSPENVCPALVRLLPIELLPTPQAGGYLGDVFPDLANFRPNPLRDPFKGNHSEQ